MQGPPPVGNPYQQMPYGVFGGDVSRPPPQARQPPPQGRMILCLYTTLYHLCMLYSCGMHSLCDMY